MNHDFWRKQTPGSPLFPDMIWSRPENRQYAGKLLIIGGNGQGFAAPAEAYSASQTAGIGTVRVLLPDILQKTVGKLFHEAEFAPSTPIGSFSHQALGEFLPMAAWADGVLLAGGFGRNSETAIVLEKLLENYQGQLTLAGDAIDYFLESPVQVLARSSTCLVLSFDQLRRLAVTSKFTQAFTSQLDLLRFVAALRAYSLLHAAMLIAPHQSMDFVAYNGSVTSTTRDPNSAVSATAIAARVATWWLQHSAQPLASATTALL